MHMGVDSRQACDRSSMELVRSLRLLLALLVAGGTWIVAYSTCVPVSLL